MHYSLLTTHYSLLTTHYSLLTTHYSLLTSSVGACIAESHCAICSALDMVADSAMILALGGQRMQHSSHTCVR